MFFKRHRHGDDGGRFLLFLSDLHCCHATGLTPAGFVTSAGNELGLNIGQAYLLRCWVHFVKALPERIDGLFLVGDVAEGQNVAEEARDLSEVDPTWQARAAAQLLLPLVERVAVDPEGQRHLYMVSGSRYHSGRGSAIEEHLGSLLKARQRGGHYAPPWRNVTIGGVHLDVAHHQSFTIRYSSMPLEREYGFMLERSGRRRQVLPDEVAIVRGHTHKGYRVWRERGALAVSLPAWKLQDRYAASSKYANRLVPDNLGAVGLRIFNQVQDGTRVRPVPFLYDHPPVEVEEMVF